MAQIALANETNISRNSLIGYAILAVNINSNNSTFVDYFVPMVSETIRVSPNEYITADEINLSLNENFGFKIPLHVIRRILNRLRRKKHIFLDEITRAYKPNREVLEQSTFKDKQLKTLENHHQLVSELKDFLLENSVDVSHEETEKYFEEFLLETGYSMFYNKKVDSSTTEENKRKRIYLVACFIKKIEKSYSPTFKYYESIVVGNMLATAMYYTEPDKYQQKFNRTEVYLDAPVIIFALGYAGEIRAEPCLELIKMLKANHASLRCFQHSVDEIKDILMGCITKLERGINDSFGTIEYFLQKKYDKSDILRLIYSLEQEIMNKLRIKIVEKPDFKETDFNIDEKGYSEFLKENIRYKVETSLERDVDSVHAIIRLRKGQKSISVENSRSLFITNNDRLSNFTKKYFKKEYNGSYVPPILTDYELTTLLWVKNPNVNPNLPRKRIIADCIASMQPSEQIINKFLDMINQLKESGDLNEGEYSLLKVSQEARQILMDETQGDEEVLTNAKVYEIVELTKQKLVEDKDSVIQIKDKQIIEKESKIKDYHNQLEVKLTEEKEKKERQIKKSERLSHIIHIGIMILVSIIFCIGQFVIIKIKDLNVPIWLQSSLSLVYLFILPAISFWGVGFLTPLKQSEARMAKRIYKSLYDVE